MSDQLNRGVVLGKRSHSAVGNKESMGSRSGTRYFVESSTSGSLQNEDGVFNTISELDAVGVVELLNQDSRPTFVLDLDPDFPSVAISHISPIFCNLALQSYDRLLDLITGNEVSEVPIEGTAKTYDEFRAWVTSVTKFDDSMDIYPLTFMYADMLWTGSTIRKRWRIISGTRSDIFAGIPVSEVSLGIDTPSRLSSNTPPRLDSKPLTQDIFEKADSVRQIDKEETATASASIVNPTTYGADESSWSSTGQSSTPSVILSSPSDAITDWTAPEANPPPDSHEAFARSINWAQTPLGALESWTPELRQITSLLMGSPQPVAIFWGEDLTMLYNAAYRDQIAGRKHPDLMGTGFRGPFKELWSTVGDIFAECARTGKAVHMINQHLPIERHGFLEETYFSWSFTPLYGRGKKILGFYNAPFETTLQHINYRRMQILRHLGEKLSLARSIKQFWSLVIEGLSDPGFSVDVPFLVLYSVVDDLDNAELASTSSTGSSISMKSCIFEGALGLPENHDAIPSRLDLKRSREGFVPAFREAMRTRQPTKLETRTGTLSESLLEHIQWRGFEEPCKEAVVCPIRPTTGDGVLGFLLVGVNPRRAYDSEYISFIDMLNRQLATSLASTLLFEEEIRKGKTAAEAAVTEKNALSEQLALQTGRLQRMTEVSPVGMFYIDAQGQLLEANDTWYTITGHSRNTHKAMAWSENFADESQATIMEGWEKLMNGESWQAELQLKHPALNPISNEWAECWVLAMAHPESSFDAVKTIMGSITDITAQKRASQDALARAILSEALTIRTQEAAESQKNFKNFSDLAPGGLIILDPDGHIAYANDQWYRISGTSVASGDETITWSSVIHGDSMPLFTAKWKELEVDLATITVELRMKKPWMAFDGVRETWILASAYPDVQNGKLSSIMACITDISEIKWAEGLQKHRLEEAEESRRQQNNFIDITSHEMRNPLSAILQSADEISQSLKEYLASPNTTIPRTVVDNCIDAAEIIALCGQHQKSIVDDILTVSKLDSNLLLITPMETQPVEIVQNAINMFNAELQKHSMTMHLNIHQSYKDLQIDWVLLDPSRLLQVLINLITNAIKFTQAEPERRVVVSISASREPPLETTKGFDYIAVKNPHLQMPFGDSWGIGEILYLRFEVEDTGRGLNDDEKKLLFQRFSQASPRTHVQYGGSGLGLFISRQITELHGGMIGVASEAGVGSTFAFFIKARRPSGPKKTHQPLPLAKSETPAQEPPKDRMPVIYPVSKPLLRESHSSPAPHSNRNATVNLHDLHILVVEDNLVNQKVLRKQLEKLGSSVAVANHGQEALDYLEKTEVWAGNEATGQRLSLILMDLEMPIMGGIACVKCIRDLELCGKIVVHVPVIAVTANARAEQIATAMGSGMDGVVSKPFRIANLVTQIEALLLDDISAS